MGVAQWGDVPAVISVGVVWLRLGCVAIGVWGMSGLDERETRVKLGGQPWCLVKHA